MFSLSLANCQHDRGISDTIVCLHERVSASLIYVLPASTCSLIEKRDAWTTEMTEVRSEIIPSELDLWIIPAKGFMLSLLPASKADHLTQI